MTLLSFKRRVISNDWSNQELGCFYRVEGELVKLGLRLEIDRGVSDEGDPWLIFLNTEYSVVLIHFCKIDGFYCLCSDALNISARDRNLNRLIEGMVDSLPTLIPQKKSSNFSVVVHPNSMLLALVFSIAFAFDNSKQAFADTPNQFFGDAPYILDYNTNLNEQSLLKVLTASSLSSTDRNAILFGAIVLAGLSSNQIEVINQIGNKLFNFLQETTISSAKEVKENSKLNDIGILKDVEKLTKLSALELKPSLNDNSSDHNSIQNYQISNDELQKIFPVELDSLNIKTETKTLETFIQDKSLILTKTVVIPDLKNDFPDQGNHVVISTEEKQISKELVSNPSVGQTTIVIAHTSEKFGSIDGWIPSLNLSLSELFTSLSTDKIKPETLTLTYPQSSTAEIISKIQSKSISTDLVLGVTANSEKAQSVTPISLDKGSALVSGFLSNGSDYKIAVQGNTTIIYESNIIGSNNSIYTETFAFSDGSYILLIGSIQDHIPMLV